MMLATDTTSAAAWKNLALIQSDPMHRFIDDGLRSGQRRGTMNVHELY